MSLAVEPSREPAWVERWSTLLADAALGLLGALLRFLLRLLGGRARSAPWWSRQGCSCRSHCPRRPPSPHTSPSDQPGGQDRLSSSPTQAAPIPANRG